jgi:hypothetical protein
MNGSGFYNRLGNELLYAPTAVYGPKFELHKPGDAAEGWAWFEDEYRARASLRLPIPSPETSALCAAEGITDTETIVRIERIVAERTARAAVSAEEVTR